jgi:glycerol-3-phosphate acyltransferase PlsY
MEEAIRMQILIPIVVIVISYLLGAIPFGLIIVRLKTGQDVRTIESGRTGGTNVVRAAGVWAGAATTFLDGAKGAVCVFLARFLLPGATWLEVVAPIMAIIGHNYSIFLIERDQKRGFRLRGGAGGATCVGGSAGLWLPSLVIIPPIGILIWYFVGYASIATMSITVISTLVFAYRAWIGASPWGYVFYGIISFFILAWSLKPNIRRLIAGNERLVGWRARKKPKNGGVIDTHHKVDE